MSGLDGDDYRVAEMMLFDTCAYKCAYCHLAESGKVLDKSQLRPYRDAAFIDDIASFFTKRSNEKKWLITMTGGEPTLMPNLDRFCRSVASAGNKVALYTAMMITESHPTFRFLMAEAARFTEYLMVSVHPEAEADEAALFRKLALLKSVGHRPILRFVGHPDRLDRLDDLAAKCKEIDIAFHPTPMFSETYPDAYTPEQSAQLLNHAVSYSQVVQIRNGLSTFDLKCHAGSKIIAIDMRTGNISPCITVHHPKLGNIYDDEFNEMDGPIFCPDAGVPCVCDIHFQSDVIVGLKDSENFAREKEGYVQPRGAAALMADIDEMPIAFNKERHIVGQTSYPEFQALSKDSVKAAYRSNKTFLEQGYAAQNHDEFLSRQIEGRLAKSFPRLFKLKVKVMDTVPGARRILR